MVVDGVGGERDFLGLVSREREPRLNMVGA